MSPDVVAKGSRRTSPAESTGFRGIFLSRRARATTGDPRCCNAVAAALTNVKVSQSQGGRHCLTIVSRGSNAVLGDNDTRKCSKYVRSRTIVDRKVEKEMALTCNVGPFVEGS